MLTLFDSPVNRSRGWSDGLAVCPPALAPCALFSFGILRGSAPSRAQSPRLENAWWPPSFLFPSPKLRAALHIERDRMVGPIPTAHFDEVQRRSVGSLLRRRPSVGNSRIGLPERRLRTDAKIDANQLVSLIKRTIYPHGFLPCPLHSFSKRSKRGTVPVFVYCGVLWQPTVSFLV
jgi:hypothetical protein